jgi:hypothetical protein
MPPRTATSTNTRNGRSKPSPKKPSGRASSRELAAMRAYLKATGGPVPPERIEAMLDEWKAAAQTGR